MNGARPRRAKLTIPQLGRGRFTQVYLTANNHYSIVLYGIVLGSVLYVGFELAARFPAVGALVSTSATLAAALVAISVGRRVRVKQLSGRV